MGSYKARLCVHEIEHQDIQRYTRLLVNTLIQFLPKIYEEEEVRIWIIEGKLY